MDVGQCKIVYEEDSSAAIDKIKDGQIIFMRHGPFNFLPLVNEYESKNPSKKPVM
jgi:ABC-type antimicrobial peptide transport system permease subunit